VNAIEIGGKMAVQPIPEDYTGLVPVLAVDDTAAAIDFYKRALGAQERMRLPSPDGKIAHAEIEISGTVVMLGDDSEQRTIKSPEQLGGTSVAVFMYVEDVDATVQQAVDSGAEITMPIDDMFWGDRYGKIVDPYGHEWHIATHKEDLSEEEMAKRAEEAMAGAA
jgi:PhnB protein